jgi:hypothetical protein
VQVGVLAQVAVVEGRECEVAVLGAFQVGGIITANDVSEQPHCVAARFVGCLR